MVASPESAGSQSSRPLNHSGATQGGGFRSRWVSGCPCYHLCSLLPLSSARLGSLLSRVEPPSFRRPPCGSNKMPLKRDRRLTGRCGRQPRSPERLDLGQRNGSRRGGVGGRQSSSFLHGSPNHSLQHPPASFCFCPMPLPPSIPPSIPPFLTLGSTEGPGPQTAGEGAGPTSLHPEPLPGRHPLGSAPL